MVNKNHKTYTQRGFSLSIVPIRINGKDYQVACDDGEEDRLLMLAGEVDDRIQSLIFNMKNKPGEPMALLLAGLMMSDELIEKQKEIDDLQQEIKRLVARANVKRGHESGDTRIAEMELAMAATMDEIAARIEKITDQIEA